MFGLAVRLQSLSSNCRSESQGAVATRAVHRHLPKLPDANGPLLPTAALRCDGRLLRGSRGQAGEVGRRAEERSSFLGSNSKLRMGEKPGHAILVPDGREFGRSGVLGSSAPSEAQLGAEHAHETSDRAGIFEGYASASAVAEFPERAQKHSCASLHVLAFPGDRWHAPRRGWFQNHR